MSHVVKRPAPQGTKAGPSGRDAPLPQFVPPQLSQPVEKPPSGPQWVHEIKLDGFRMAGRIDNGRVQLLTRTGLDWTNRYPSAIAALANVRVKTAYIDGELCGVDEAGLPSFARTQAATDGERGVHLVYYAFDLLHLGGWDSCTTAAVCFGRCQGAKGRQKRISSYPSAAIHIIARRSGRRPYPNRATRPEWRQPG